MGKNRMAAKQCPQCDQQVPVACKTCPCGFSFFAQKQIELEELKKSESSNVKESDLEEKKEGANEEENKPRRTERTKRLRPDFYNSVEIDKKTRKQHVRRRRSLSNLDLRKRRAVMLHHPASTKQNSIMGNLHENMSDKEDDQDGNDSNGDDSISRKKRGRPKYGRDKNGADQEEAMYNNLSSEKAFQYSAILADINRKISIGRSMNCENVLQQKSTSDVIPSHSG